MRRFWIDRSCLKAGEFILKDSLFHHVCRVSKIQKNEPFELFAEGLQKYTVVLTSVQRSRACAKILKVHPVPKLAKPSLHLALSVPRFSKLDFIIEKSVELGVKEFHPFISSFSFMKKPSQFPIAKRKRLQKIIENSLALSGRTEPLKVHPVCFLKELQIPKNHRAFMAYEGDDLFTEDTSKISFKQVLSSLEREKNAPKEIWLLIGSEGGFTSEEARHFLQSGVHLVSLGEQILRVETACLLGLSILKYHYHN